MATAQALQGFCLHHISFSVHNKSQCRQRASARLGTLRLAKDNAGACVRSPASIGGQLPGMHCRPMRRKTAGIVRAEQPANAGSTEDMEVPAGSVSVVLLAGGVGKRMGASMPKQYLPLIDQPIALYSLFTFAEMEEVGEIVVVCDPSWRHIFSDVEQRVKVGLKYALPGIERQDSVFSGLQEIRGEARLVAIHDSARPLVSAADFLKVMKDALKYGAAVLGVPVKATIKEAGSDRFVAKTLDRRTLWEMQTPQVIEPALLRRGFDLIQSERLEVTDDVSIVEHLKHPVCITEGSYTNLKVTTPDDLLVAERILHQAEQSQKASDTVKVASTA